MGNLHAPRAFAKFRVWVCGSLERSRTHFLETQNTEARQLANGQDAPGSWVPPRSAKRCVQRLVFASTAEVME